MHRDGSVKGKFFWWWLEEFTSCLLQMSQFWSLHDSVLSAALWEI